MSVHTPHVNRRASLPLHIKLNTYLSKDEVVNALVKYSTLPSDQLNKIGLAQVFTSSDPSRWPAANSQLLSNIMRFMMFHYGMSCCAEPTNPRLLVMRQDFAQWLSGCVE